MNFTREVKRQVSNKLRYVVQTGMITVFLFSGLRMKAQPGLQLDPLLPPPAFSFSSELPVFYEKTIPQRAILSPLFSPAPEFQADEMAFFCRIELQLDKWARRNIRFRLGSVDYVNYLEGKTLYWPQ
jgi:hypothetical protein